MVSERLSIYYTDYAPNTTGMPYYKNNQDGTKRDCSMENIKHLYDIARLFEETDNFQTTSKFFSQIAKKELAYRGNANSLKLIFDIYIRQKK